MRPYKAYFTHGFNDWQVWQVARLLKNQKAAVTE